MQITTEMYLFGKIYYRLVIGLFWLTFLRLENVMNLSYIRQESVVQKLINLILGQSKIIWSFFAVATTEHKFIKL